LQSVVMHCYDFNENRESGLWNYEGAQKRLNAAAAAVPAVKA